MRHAGLATYEEATARLAGRQTRKLQNNTYLERIDENTIGVRLHATYVVTYYADGRVTLNSGGWQTVTTKDRLNIYSPFAVIQAKRKWFVDFTPNREGMFPFYDGMTFSFDLEGNQFVLVDNERRDVHASAYGPEYVARGEEI